MLEQARQRTIEFQSRLEGAGLDVALITDESSIAYLAGFWGYLAVEFGRPTFLLVRRDEAPLVITPSMESEMVSAMTWVEAVMTREDAGARRWEHVLGRALGRNPGRIGVETAALPAVVRNWFDRQMPGTRLDDVSTLLGGMRMIKSPQEIAVMAQAGEIAVRWTENSVDASAIPSSSRKPAVNTSRTTRAVS